jgi:hypothetical protein
MRTITLDGIARRAKKTQTRSSCSVRLCGQGLSGIGYEVLEFAVDDVYCEDEDFADGVTVF